MNAGIAMMLKTILGLDENAIAGLREVMDPEKLKAMIGDFRARFDAMEARNIAMHAMLVELTTRNTPLLLPMGDPIQAEMDRQLVLFENGASEHVNGSNRCDDAGTNRTGFQFGSD